MLALLDVVAPVFLVTGAGYLAALTGLLKQSHVDGLNKFTQSFAIPCLLFKAAMELDLRAAFDPGLLLTYYVASTTTFFLGIAGARTLFRRRPGEAVAIGFASLFSNTVILGIPIVTRAYGEEALVATIAIVALHAPYNYFLGITVMEISRADGRGAVATARTVIRAMLHNALMIGLALGFAANLAGFRPPGVVMEALDLVIAAALPTALVGLGGILTRYQLRRSLGEALMISFLSLAVHPALAYLLGAYVFDLPLPYLRAAVLVAAMAPGVNAYLFASMYNRAEGAAASTVLLATALSVFSVTVWLTILG